MADSRVNWLKGELPELVAEGLLAPDAADRIRRRYEARSVGRGRNLALIAFGVMGAKLIGSGLILLIAHNWADLSAGLRAGLALSLLLTAQGLAGFAHLRRPDSLAWRESTAAFLVLAVGGCMALIAQTYNIQTAVDSFLLHWILLTLPVVYVTRSRVAAVLFFVGIGWASCEGVSEHTPLLWGLLAAILPFLVGMVREAGGARGKALVLWSAALAAPFASLFVVPELLEDVWMVFYASLFAALFAVDAWIADPDAPLWQRPLAGVGALGASGVALALTFSDAWEGLDMPAALSRQEDPWFAVPAAWGVTALLGLAASAFAVRRLREQAWAPGLLAALPLLTGLGVLAALVRFDGAGQALLSNGYVLALGLAALLAGLRSGRLGLANAGMALLSVLFFFRFVDADLTLVLRGVAFIVIGVAFLGMNVRLLWARGEVRP